MSMSELTTRMRRAAAGLWSDSLQHIPAALNDGIDEIERLRARLAEHESNQRAYEEIIGKKTYREVADQLALVETLQRRLDLEFDSYAKEGWEAKLASARKALEEVPKLLKSAMYSEPTGSEENAWNAAVEHIEDGFAALKDLP